MIRVVRDLIRADRLGDWKLHVESFKKLVPLFHIMDRSNYSRWGTVYLNDILILEQKYPDVYEEFLKGQFCLKRSKTSFTSIPGDQGLETTIMRSSKSTHGIIGVTHKKD